MEQPNTDKKTPDVPLWPQLKAAGQAPSLQQIYSPVAQKHQNTYKALLSLFAMGQERQTKNVKKMNVSCISSTDKASQTTGTEWGTTTIGKISIQCVCLSGHRRKKWKLSSVLGREDIQDLSSLVVRMGTGASCLWAMHQEEGTSKEVKNVEQGQVGNKQRLKQLWMPSEEALKMLEL